MANWKEVPEFPHYLVSDEGDVRGPSGKILRPRKHRGGYVCVCLCRDGKIFYTTRHSVVAAAFIGPRPKGHDVNHKDGDKKNNMADNLEYVTRLANIRHSIAVLGNRVDGDFAHGRKLSYEKARQLRKMRKDGVPVSQLMKVFGLSESHIYSILKGDYW